MVFGGLGFRGLGVWEFLGVWVWGFVRCKENGVGGSGEPKVYGSG